MRDDSARSMVKKCVVLNSFQDSGILPYYNKKHFLCLDLVYLK